MQCAINIARIWNQWTVIKLVQDIIGQVTIITGKPTKSTFIFQ